ncbi:MAG: glucose-1-phosphate adenylyltransferase [Candidatus Krumholzibacteria bacterium]|nr:glucose-1-phosphate adenylyltransferase [Candidatus Krumholzibacteria bacterium]
MDRAVAFILAGGAGKRLSLLTAHRAKPAVPFAGRYRIIDFTLTNCVTSGIGAVYVLAQYISRSLERHLGIGKPWDLDRATGGLHVLHPHLGFDAADWYRGTADALYQNAMVLRSLDCPYVLILSGDHVYTMDYGSFLDYHEAHRRPVTVAVTEVPASMTRHFGIAKIDRSGLVTRFHEKPAVCDSTLASMGIYIFEREFLVSVLERFKSDHDDLDFGKHVLPRLVPARDVAAYRYEGFWLDIGTLRSYYEASLALLAHRPRLDLTPSSGAVMTAPDEYPPLTVSSKGRVEGSMICNGCVVSGTVRRSILSPGVIVEAGAEVDQCVLLHDCVIGKGARLRRCILDKGVRVGAGTVIGEGDAGVVNRMQPGYLDFGITLIGRDTRIPAGIAIGTNSLVAGSRGTGRIPKRDIPDGGAHIASGIIL